ncbi:MAG TPA: pyridoxal phosphate-dependent aminotransferase [Candidatus Binatia bacterium]|nr:pyridoxal phosphate-dependent aminotransferase [Candidatus Binatia bacterium]
MTTLAERTLLIKPSVTLAIAAKAGKLRSQGIDVINFSAGEPDFDTPDRIKAAAIEALKRGMTKYTDVRGIEPLRQAIAQKYLSDYGLTYKMSEILVSCGAKHSLYNLFQAVVNPGDEILVPAPYWVSYADMALLAGGVPKIIQTSEATGFRIGAQQLANALSSRTRIFVLNSPSNPTGASYEETELMAIAQVLERHNCLIVTDDIYDKIVYDGFTIRNLATLAPSLRDRIVIVNGVSKSYAMTGWRIGYALGPANIIDAAAKIQSQSTSNPTSIAQAAALEAIQGPQEDVAMMVDEFAKRRNVVVERLNAISGVQCLKPQGAFYVFPNIAAFIGKNVNGKSLTSPCDIADYLLEEAKVAAVPGEDFGSNAHIRLSYATSLENIEEGCRRMRDVFAKIH